MPDLKPGPDPEFPPWGLLWVGDGFGEAATGVLFGGAGAWALDGFGSGVFGDAAGGLLAGGAAAAAAAVIVGAGVG